MTVIPISPNTNILPKMREKYWTISNDLSTRSQAMLLILKPPNNRYLPRHRSNTPSRHQPLQEFSQLYLPVDSLHYTTQTGTPHNEINKPWHVQPDPKEQWQSPSRTPRPPPSSLLKRLAEIPPSPRRLQRQRAARAQDALIAPAVVVHWETLRIRWSRRMMITRG